jgi:predicted nucleic acid-binding protein
MATVSTFSKPEEAHLLRSRLEAAGIPAFVRDELTIQMNWLYSMAAGPVLSDAILAAYAIEHRATLFTNDGDFARFPGLKWENPFKVDYASASP